LTIRTERSASFKQVIFRYKKQQEFLQLLKGKSSYKNKFKINIIIKKVKETMMFMKVGLQKAQSDFQLKTNM
jgi:hypothetical protein